MSSLHFVCPNFHFIKKNDNLKRSFRKYLYFLRLYWVSRDLRDFLLWLIMNKFKEVGLTLFASFRRKLIKCYIVFMVASTECRLAFSQYWSALKLPLCFARPYRFRSPKLGLVITRFMVGWQGVRSVLFVVFRAISVKEYKFGWRGQMRQSRTVPTVSNGAFLSFAGALISVSKPAKVRM